MAGYGWGSVYRVYPQQQLQQELPQNVVTSQDLPLPVQAPDEAYTPWWRIWRPPVSSAHFQQDVPELISVGPPAAYQPPPWPVGLPQWWRSPWSSAHYQQNVPEPAAIGPSPAIMPPWETVYQAFWRVWRPPLSPAHTQQDVAELVAIGPPQALFGVTQPYIQPGPLSFAFFQTRPPAVQQVIILAPAFPPAWIANWAAYLTPPLASSFFQVPGKLAIGNDPVLYNTANLLPAYLRLPFQQLQALPITPQVVVVLTPLPVPPVAWNPALYYRDFPLTALQRLRLAPVGPPPVAFPKLGQWGPENRWYWPLVETATRLRLLSVGDAPALFLAPNLGAAYRREPFPRLVSLPFLPPPIILPALGIPPQAWVHHLYYRPFPLYAFEPRVLEAILQPDDIHFVPLYTTAPANISGTLGIQ